MQAGGLPHCLRRRGRQLRLHTGALRFPICRSLCVLPLLCCGVNAAPLAFNPSHSTSWPVLQASSSLGSSRTALASEDIVVYVKRSFSLDIFCTGKSSFTLPNGA